MYLMSLKRLPITNQKGAAMLYPFFEAKFHDAFCISL